MIHGGERTGGTSDCSQSVLIENDGKIVFAEHQVKTSFDMFIIRLEADGSYDTGFNSTGYLYFDGPFGPGSWDTGQKSLIDDFGDYIVGGFSMASDFSERRGVVWKYSHDGVLRISFEIDGHLMFVDSRLASDIIVVDENKFLVTGSAEDTSGNNSVSLWKLDSNENFDITFNSTWSLVLEIGSTYSEGIALKDDYLGNYYVYGSSFTGYSRPYLWRLRSNGLLDTDYATNGYLELVVPLDMTVCYTLGQGSESYGNKDLIDSTCIDTLGKNYSVEWMYEDLFQISDLNSNFVVYVDDINIASETDNGTYGGQDVTLTFIGPLDGELLFVDVFTDMIIDRSWVNVSGELDLKAFKSYIRGMSEAPGVLGTFALYIPYSKEYNSVGICPGIDGIDAVGP